MPTYLLARLPAVILLIAVADGVLGAEGSPNDCLGPARGIAMDDESSKLDEGVTRPLLFAGVIRPLSLGVTRPLYREADDTRPGPGNEALDDATDELLE